MKRRDFLRAGGASLLGSTVLAGAGTSQADAQTTGAGGERGNDGEGAKFQLKYAPHFGMFAQSAGRDEVDQLKFAADRGFTAWEDNGMKGKPVELQERIAQAMEELGMTMGVCVATASFDRVTFAGRDRAAWDAVLKDIRDSVDVAKRVNAKWMTVVPGRYDPAAEWDYQTANCVELLQRCAEILEPHELVMVLEPLNWWTNHAGVFLHKAPQAFLICRAVASPACKILYDVYHQQITEGNLIPNIDRSWDEIAYFQTGDNPGRKEPGTGEINYRNLFKHIHEKGFEGIVGMEHGNSRRGREGEEAVIAAYRAADDF